MKEIFKSFLVRAQRLSLIGGAIILLTLFNEATAQSNFWRQCAGPYGGGGAAAITFDSLGNIYAAVSSFGIYFSADNGSSWTQDNTGLTNFYVEAFAALPGGAMLVATDSGMFRSSGLKGDWSLVNSDFKFSELDSSGWVSSLEMGPKGFVYVGTANGLFRSSDLGNTWSPVFAGSYAVYSLKVAPSGKIYAGYSSGVAMSADSGLTWTGFGGGYIDIRQEVGSLAIMPNGDVAVSTSWNGIMFYSANGDTGKGYVPGPTGDGGGLLTVCKRFASDTSANLYCSSYEGLYKLSPGDTSWVHVSIDTADYYITALTSHGNTILVGTGSHGIYRSTDYGATWSHPTYGMAALTIGCLAVAKPRNSTNQGGYIFAGTSGNGIYRSTDNGSNWTSSNYGITHTYEYWDYQISAGPMGKLYTITDNGIFWSSDGGTNWDSLYGAPRYSAGIAALCTNVPGDTLGLLLTTGTSCIYTSTDGGTTWISGSADYGAGSNEVSGYAFMPCDTCGNTGGYIFAGGAYSVFRSSDYGATWFLDISGLDNFYTVTSFCIPHGPHGTPIPGCIYAGTIYAGVYFSTDYGLHWNLSGLSGHDVLSLVSAQDGSVFAGTYDAGVFRLDTAGGTWVQLNSGLTGSEVSSLASDSLGYIYCATETGVFRSAQTVTSVVNAIDRRPHEFALNQNYPNPFNPATSISYELPSVSHVTLKVYDILGREVISLVNAVQSAGEHSVTLDASNLSSGVYFYRLTTPAFTQVRKMLLEK